MTIKARNRFYMGFSILALVIFIVDLVFFHYQKFSGSLQLPQVRLPANASDSFLFGYKASFSFIAIFSELFYLCAASFAVLYAFYKTQAGELAYFLLFLLSVLLDATRLYVPMMNLAGSYTTALIAVNNLVLTGSLLGPVSLLSLVLLSSEEYRQNLEQNCLILIVICAFVAFSIPINTGIILPSFACPSAFSKILSILVALIILISVGSMAMNNFKREFSQLTTLGFFALEAGTLILRQCRSLFQLVLGIILIFGGTFLYFKELHNQYLWTY